MQSNIWQHRGALGTVPMEPCRVENQAQEKLPQETAHSFSDGSQSTEGSSRLDTMSSGKVTMKPEQMVAN